MQTAPLFFVLVAAASCGGAKPQPAPVALAADADADAGPAAPVAAPTGDAGTTTARPAAVDAGEAVAVAAQDAGAATSAGAQVTSSAARPVPGQVAGPSKIHDRLLGKVKDKGAFDEAAMKTRIEKATGAAVAKVKLGPGSYAVVQFAPTSPPRDAAAQKKLVEKLQASGLFDAVEGDKVMMLK